MTLATATLLLHQALASWFLFYETPQPSLQQIIPLISEDVVIATPNLAEPLVGLESFVARASENSIGVAIDVINAHHFRTLEVLSSSESAIEAQLKVEYMQSKSGTLTAHAMLSYQVTLALEGNRWRFRKLTASVSETLPIQGLAFSDSLRTNTELLRKATQDLVKTQTQASDWDNRISEHLHHWYWIFDVRPETSTLEPLIGDPIQITMREVFTDRAAFLAWYSKFRTLPMFNSHRIELIDIRAKSETGAVVDIYIRWQNQTGGAPLTSHLMRNTMTVIEDGSGKLKVTGYLPRALKN